MGRSVDYLSKANEVAYIHFETENEDDSQFEWDCFKEDLIEVLCSELNMQKCDKWDGRETHIFVEGNDVEIGLSEYCGLVSLSCRIDESAFDYLSTDEEADEVRQAAEKWIESNWPKVVKLFHGYGTGLNKVGTFSNGESVFQKS